MRGCEVDRGPTAGDARDHSGLIVALAPRRAPDGAATSRAGFRGHTSWPRSLAAPVRDFLTTA
jgi:hypothetical protein